MNKREYLKQYREKNREKIRDYHAKWQSENKDLISKRRRANRDKTRNQELIRLYGISLEDYEEMLKNQRGVCVVCGETSDRKLDVDHNHITGTVRELLCRRCNTTIGRVKENIHLLRQMILYLEKHNEMEKTT